MRHLRSGSQAMAVGEDDGAGSIRAWILEKTFET
jgi:hypothetical protein